jgi:hypothetical protein
MHWWRTDRLVVQLADNTLAERDALRYMLLSAGLYEFALYSSSWFGNWRGWQLLVEFGVALLISLVGIHECYKANAGAGGRQFIGRFSALAIPVGLKLALASLAIGFFLSYTSGYVINASTFRDPRFVHEVLAFVLGITFTFVFYWRVAYHLARVVQRERSNPSLHPTAYSGLRPPPAAGELKR